MEEESFDNGGDLGNGCDFFQLLLNYTGYFHYFTLPIIFFFTMDLLKFISENEDVLEITGDYSGGATSIGARHEHRH